MFLESYFISRKQCTTWNTNISLVAYNTDQVVVNLLYFIIDSPKILPSDKLSIFRPINSDWIKS